MEIHVHSQSYLDGREVTEGVVKHLPAVARLATGRQDAAGRAPERPGV